MDCYENPRERSGTTIGLISLCGLFALAAVAMSASAGERFTVILAALALSVAVAGIGFIVAAMHGVVSRAGIVPFAALGITVSVAITHWPLRLAYAVSKGAFEQVAERLRAGERMGPRRVGLFSIRGTEVYTSKDIVCLWTDLHGRTGFVRCQADEVPFNVFSTVSLGGGWQFIHED